MGMLGRMWEGIREKWQQCKKNGDVVRETVKLLRGS